MVSEEDVAHIVASWTGVPVQKLTGTESVKLLIWRNFHQRLIGQDEAVKAVSRAIRRARVGLKILIDLSRALSFQVLLVGKLIDQIISLFFGSEEARLDWTCQNLWKDIQLVNL